MFTYTAGFIGHMLNWKGWTPLGRMTFAVYLIHPIVIFIYVGNRRDLNYVDDFSVVSGIKSFIWKIYHYMISLCTCIFLDLSSAWIFDTRQFYLCSEACVLFYNCCCKDQGWKNSPMYSCRAKHRLLIVNNTMLSLVLSSTCFTITPASEFELFIAPYLNMNLP